MEFRMLKASEIECRINTISGRGLSLLLYKTARTDMQILNETYGEMNWQCEYKEIKGNMYCGISVWDKEKEQWITKWDCGVESYTEKEKGEASDSFKRAGFKWNIGTELYTSPFIWITPRADMKPYNTKDLKGNEANEFYEYKERAYTTKTSFKVTEIGYNENKEINRLTIIDNKGNTRFYMIPIEEQKKMNELIVRVNDLLEQTNTDRDKFYKHYKVTSNMEMTLPQLEDAVEKLLKKIGN